jgi:glycosyltransferase involved in cell wall biosynthesis
LIKSHEIILRQKAIETYQYATIIAANQRLKDILALNGLTDNVVSIPHGVKPRPQLPFPEVKDVVKFYYCGRIQYSKGLHNLLMSFDGIDKSLYELHIIGDAESSGPSRRYDQRIRKMAIGKNVIFHGRLPNESIESVIKDMHVMIHPAIFLEVYGISIAESLSIGRPVLATRCGGAEMQVYEGVNGWLVEPNDVKALHVKIEEIIHLKNNLGEISNNCNLPHPMKEYVIGLVDNYKRLLLKNF